MHGRGHMLITYFIGIIRQFLNTFSTVTTHLRTVYYDILFFPCHFHLLVLMLIAFCFL